MKQLVSLQVLRAVAALSVVCCHSGENLRYWVGVNADWSNYAAVGVDLFFVISGFIITTVTWESFGRPREIVPFTFRRLLRIGFLYWLMTTVYVAANSYPMERIIESYLLLPSPRHLIPIAWTLVLEVMFYAIVAISLPLPRALALAFIAIAITVIANASLGFYSDPMIIEFLFGVGIAVLYRGGVRLPAIASTLLAIAAVAAFLIIAPLDTTGQRHFLLTWGVPAALLVSAAVLGPELPNARVVLMLAALGDASYALYLTHMPIAHFVGNMARLSGIDFHSVIALLAYLMLAMLVASGLAVLVYRLVEAPVLALSKRVTARRQVA